jgi:hypothetical protein
MKPLEFHNAVNLTEQVANAILCFGEIGAVDFRQTKNGSSSLSR